MCQPSSGASLLSILPILLFLLVSFSHPSFSCSVSYLDFVSFLVFVSLNAREDIGTVVAKIYRGGKRIKCKDDELLLCMRARVSLYEPVVKGVVSSAVNGFVSVEVL